VKVTYRNLYFRAQKKIEELTKENQELVGRLELAKQKNETDNEIIGTLASLIAASKTNLVERTTTCAAPSSVAGDEKNNAGRTFSKRSPRRKM